MSQLQMPKIDNKTLDKKDYYISEIEKIIIKKENVLSNKDEIRPYETDALTAYREMPMVVVLPETIEQVSSILKFCNQNKIKVVPRGKIELSFPFLHRK